MSKQTTKKFLWMKTCIADSFGINENNVGVLLLTNIGCDLYERRQQGENVIVFGQLRASQDFGLLPNP